MLVSTIHLLSLVLFMFLAHMRAIIAAELPPGCLSGALMLQGGLWGLAQRTIPANKALTISSIYSVHTKLAILSVGATPATATNAVQSWASFVT